MCILQNWRQLKRNSFNHSRDWKRAFPLTGAWFGLACYWYLCRQLRSSDLKRGYWGHPKWAEEALITESEPWVHGCYRPGAGSMLTHTLSRIPCSCSEEPQAQRGKTALLRSQSLWFHSWDLNRKSTQQRSVDVWLLLRTWNAWQGPGLGLPQPSDAGKSCHLWDNGKVL